MFDSLTGALSNAYSALAGKKELNESNIDEGIRAVRQALLEADVNFKVAKDFIKELLMDRHRPAARRLLSPPAEVPALAAAAAAAAAVPCLTYKPPGRPGGMRGAFK